jgi:hypothetical protein
MHVLIPSFFFSHKYSSLTPNISGHVILLIDQESLSERCVLLGGNWIIVQGGREERKEGRIGVYRTVNLFRFKSYSAQIQK